MLTFALSRRSRRETLIDALPRLARRECPLERAGRRAVGTAGRPIFAPGRRRSERRRGPPGTRPGAAGPDRTGPRFPAVAAFLERPRRARGDLRRRALVGRRPPAETPRLDAARLMGAKSAALRATRDEAFRRTASRWLLRWIRSAGLPPRTGTAGRRKMKRRDA
jgi:hypothetical protein